MIRDWNFPKLFTELPDESPSLSVLCEDSINLCVAAVNDLVSSELKISAIAGLNTQGTYTLNFSIPEGFYALWLYRIRRFTYWNNN